MYSLNISNCNQWLLGGMNIKTSIRYIDFGKGIRLSASPFRRRITDPVPIFSGV